MSTFALNTASRLLYRPRHVIYFRRMILDVYEELVSPVSAAVIVIQQAARKRKNVLKPLMTFCQSVLTQPPVDPRRKDGVLHIIGTVADVLIEASKKINNVYIVFVSAHN